jgi:hypothetical protein
MRYIYFPTTEKIVFKIKIDRGDERWRPSIQINHWWFGEFYYHLIFL